jgi:hypothetical protein
MSCNGYEYTRQQHHYHDSSFISEVLTLIKLGRKLTVLHQLFLSVVAKSVLSY